MKIKIIILAVITAFSILGVQAQKGMFDKLSNHKDITTVYISKSLLKMMPDIDTGGADIKGLAGKLEQMEIYSSNSNKEAANIIRNEVAGMVKSKTYEVLMKIKDQGSNITFYAFKEKDKIKDLVMFIDQPDESTIIRIMGNFTAEDIQKVMDGADVNKKK
ncbi:MAG: DUF4252 domain-containing protein [Dysgonomonas sp.]